MSKTWEGDDNSTESSISPDLRKQLKAASGQSDENDTIPALSPDMRAQLKAAAKTVEIDPSEFDLEAKPLAGNALLKNHSTVVFALIDSEVLLPIHVIDRVIIGRPDVESGEKVDVDLTPYGGRERGISRRHAVLYRTSYTVSLVDLNSSNGTYLNGVRLVPHQPRLLREGDEVRLGNMRFHTYFDR
jgi:pSer/pThr/pTyr-binding forkhead associated (FHA) protein